MATDTCGEQRVKLLAGLQVWNTGRDDGQRTPPFDLDTAANRPVGHASPVQLTAVHHNLTRRRAGA